MDTLECIISKLDVKESIAQAIRSKIRLNELGASKLIGTDITFNTDNLS